MPDSGRTTCHLAAADRCRRHRYGRWDAGSHGPRGRRRADRNPLRIRRRKLGTRKLQKPLSESGRGRYDADAQKVSPTRLVKGDFFREVEEAENRGATAEELKTLLGKGRAKKGMFEGDLDNGELEIGQVASLFREQQTAAEIVRDIVTEYRNILSKSREKLSI